MEETLFRYLVDLELKLLRAEVRASRDALDALIAEDFMEIGAIGRSFGKQEVLERLPRERGISFEASDFSGRQLAPDVALLNYRSVRGDGSGDRASLRSSIWRREASGWRMVFHQGTTAEQA